MPVASLLLAALYSIYDARVLSPSTGAIFNQSDCDTAC